MSERLNINVLLGRVLDVVQNQRDEQIYFHAVNGDEFTLYHSQDCCERVRVEDITGDLDNLVGSPITLAEEVHYEGNVEPEDVKKEERGYDDSFTWTYYKLATIKGYVTIRFLGESNGYYSESVDFIQLSGKKAERPQEIQQILDKYPLGNMVFMTMV